MLFIINNHQIIKKHPEFVLHSDVKINDYNNTNISDILWKNVAEYHIFDLPMHKGVYSERIAKYNEIVNKICKKWNENNKTSCPIKAVQHKLFKTEESVKSFFKDTMKKKFLCPIEIPELQIEKNCRIIPW